MVPQIPYLPLSNCTPHQVGDKPSLPQRLEHRGHLLHMLCPAVTVDDNVIQVGGYICGVKTQHVVHEALEGGRDTEQPERKCNKLVQLVWSGEGNFFLRLRRQGNLPEAIGKKHKQCITDPGARRPTASNCEMSFT